MNLTMHVKRGDKFLPDVSLSELEQTHRNEPHGKTKTMLHVAIRRKKGDILDTISKAVGIATSTIHDWLSRAGGRRLGAQTRLQESRQAMPSVRGTEEIP